MKLTEALNYLLDNNYTVELLDEASESDAYRRTKAKLDELPNDIKDELIDNANDKNHWQREYYNELLSIFGLRNTEALYYTPGLARIAYGELDLQGDNENSRAINLLRRYVHFITIAHKDDFDRYLNFKGPNGIKECTFEDLDAMFGTVAANNIKDEYNAIASKKYKKSDYKIIWLKDYKTARQYRDFTEPNTWCYFEDSDTFKMYTNNGRTKLYLAIKPGFEDLQPGDPGYGQSMLGIDINPGENGLPAELLHVSNRYNHEEDPELDASKNPAGDNRFTATELSELLGAPFWEICPPYTKEELHKNNIYVAEDLPEILDDILEHVDSFSGSCNKYARETYGFEFSKSNAIVNNEKHTFYTLYSNKDEVISVLDENRNIIAYMAYRFMITGKDNSNEKTFMIAIDDKDLKFNLYTYKNNKLVTLFSKCGYSSITDNIAIINTSNNSNMTLFDKTTFKTADLPIKKDTDLKKYLNYEETIMIIKPNDFSIHSKVFMYDLNTMKNINIGNDCYDYYIFEYDTSLVLFHHTNDTVTLYDITHNKFLPIGDNTRTIRFANNGKHLLKYGLNNNNITIYSYNNKNCTLTVIADNLTDFEYDHGYYYAVDSHNKKVCFDLNFNQIKVD